jgi:LacI family transcriptional regulator/LacI family purine nucleotide synthesis repressor
MREKIIALADELGYKQPSVAKREAEERSYNIGVLIHERYFDKYNSFYLQIYQSVNLKAGSKGCFTLLETISSEMESDKKLPKLVSEQKVDGIIVIGRMEDSYLELLEKKAGRPLIYIDFCDCRREADAVISDSFYGAYSLTQYLVEKGHRDIAYVGTLLSTGSITDRYLGYTKCLMENGIELREEWRIDDRYLDTGKVDEVNLIQLPKQMPTAFFCNCDLVGSMLVRKLENMGYRIPEDISVVGYDNYLYPGLCDVGITTYEVDIKEMARRAVNNLLKKIKGEKYREGISIVEGHLVVKNSVKNIN